MQRAILLITKTPGRLPVKTRLAEHLGSLTANSLYCCFLQDIGTKFRQMEIPLRVHHLPGRADEVVFLENLLGKVAGCFPQLGADLGARMKQAFESGFAAGFEQLVLIGGDCPDLTPSIFNHAFEALHHTDCVLGPTEDGGYYLIGFSNPAALADVFDFPDWGARTVYGETISRLNQRGTSYFELPARSDVDTLLDLVQLWEQNQSGWFSTSSTIRALNDLIENSQVPNWIRLEGLPLEKYDFFADVPAKISVDFRESSSRPYDVSLSSDPYTVDPKAFHLLSREQMLEYQLLARFYFPERAVLCLLMSNPNDLRSIAAVLGLLHKTTGPIRILDVRAIVGQSIAEFLDKIQFVETP